MKFFDCNCAFGPYRTRVFRFARTADELIEEMDFANIERALVYHTAMRFDHPAVGNERVVAETAGQPRLLPSWSLLPSQTGEQPAVDVLAASNAASKTSAPCASFRTTTAISATTSPGGTNWPSTWNGGFPSSFGPASTRSPSCCGPFPT